MSDSTRELTRKQRVFVEAYISNGYNGTQAAIAAGYSKGAARVIASENLKKSYIASAIETRLAAIPPSVKQKRISCYLYLMLAENGLVKIGIATHPQKRLGVINVASPIEVKLLDSFPDTSAFDSEQELHAMFKNKRVRGEWYSLAEEDIALIRRRYGREQRG